MIEEAKDEMVHSLNQCQQVRLVMTRYRAEAYHTDSGELATLVGHFQSQVEARHRCHRHAQGPLEFKAPTAGLWKAQGAEYWYQISRLDDYR